MPSASGSSRARRSPSIGAERLLARFVGRDCGLQLAADALHRRLDEIGDTLGELAADARHPVAREAEREAHEGDEVELVAFLEEVALDEVELPVDDQRPFVERHQRRFGRAAALLEELPAHAAPLLVQGAETLQILRADLAVHGVAADAALDLANEDPELSRHALRI